MKIFIICSKRFYDQIPPIKTALETAGHEVTLPNAFDHPTMEAEKLALGEEKHAAWKGTMFKQSEKVVESVDAVLVLNFEKDGVPNYIGGATFLEMYDAFRLGKKIFLYNDIPTGMLENEICGFSPTLIDGDLTRIG